MNKMRRKLMLVPAALVAAGVFGFSKAHQSPKKTSVGNTEKTPIADAKLGINLAAIAYWGNEFPFIDLFKQSQTWFIENKTPEDSTLSIDVDGWVTQLAKDVQATTIISAFDDGHFPSGDYVILYGGEGEISIPNYVTTSVEPGRIVVNIDGRKGHFLLTLTKTNPENYIKNIRVIPKADEKTYQQDRWNPHFLKRWAGVGCLRFMDFGRANNSTQKNWESRAKPTDASFVMHGVPVEWMVDLANRLHCDAWFCIPHQADDDYVRQYAQYAAQHLKPALRAWVEYSNEVWNGSFKQHAYAKKTGLSLKFTENAWEAASTFYAHRSVQIFKHWEETFGSKQRLVRVLGAQSANVEVAKQVLGFKLPNKQRAGDYADVLAIANYVHLSVSANTEPSDKVVARWSLDKLFEYVHKKALPESKSWLVKNKRVADAYQLKLVAYEAGQHVVGYGEATNNDKLTQLFIKANSDARMGEVYTESLMAWQQVGGDLICSYNSVGGWSKWGSWGLLQHYDDAPSPKFKATMRWAKSRGQKVNY